MHPIEIQLSEDLRAFVDAQVAAGGFGSPEVYLQQLLESDQRRMAMAEIESLLLDGVDSPKSEMTDEDWQAIRDIGYQHIESRVSS